MVGAVLAHNSGRPTPRRPLRSEFLAATDYPEPRRYRAGYPAAPRHPRGGLKPLRAVYPRFYAATDNHGSRPPYRS